MNRADYAAARQECPEDAKQKRAEHQPHVPDLHHAALFLHHHGVQERRARQPRQERRILDRIPSPITAPAEHRVGPVSAQQNSRGLKHPRNHRPLARQMNPLLARVAGQQRAQRKSKRNREAGVSRIQVRRMDHHFRILQQGSQSVAIGARDVIHHAIRSRRRERFERAGHEIIQRQEENLYAGHHHANVRHQLAILVPVSDQHRENIDGQQEAPEQQRTFLPRPQRG